MLSKLDSSAIGVATVTVGAVVNIACNANMHVVHVDLGVADQTGEDRAVSGVGVAGSAVRPGSIVSTRVYREEIDIVLRIVRYLTSGVTSETDGTDVAIFRHTHVDDIDCTLGVTAEAVIYRAISRINMTVGTLAPVTAVCSRINREIGSIVFGVNSLGSLRMAGETGRAFPAIGRDSLVNRVGRRLVVTDQAGKLGPVSRIGVADYTIIPLAAVGSGVYREVQSIVLSVFSAGTGRMTGQAGVAVVCI